MNEFKLIIAGGRDFNDHIQLERVLTQMSDSMPDDRPIAIVSGMARGADRLGWEFAHHFHVKCYEFPADWDTYGKRAGYLRNVQMAQFSDGLLAFWDGQSKGTSHMITIMQRMHKPVTIINY